MLSSNIVSEGRNVPGQRYTLIFFDLKVWDYNKGAFAQINNHHTMTCHLRVPETGDSEVVRSALVRQHIEVTVQKYTSDFSECKVCRDKRFPFLETKDFWH